MIIQLNPQIPVVTPKGKGHALFLTDYGLEHDHMWTVAINDTGELWSFFNRDVKMEKNITIGRTLEDWSVEGLRKKYNAPSERDEKNKEYQIGISGL